MDQSIPSFFVPGRTPEEYEEAYRACAAIAGRHPSEPQQRLYSITFNHDGEEWTATVGQSLKGVKERTTRGRGGNPPRVSRTYLSDDAVVCAIFPGVPYVVVTNSPPARSRWANPFYAGQPKRQVFFAGRDPAE